MMVGWEGGLLGFVKLEAGWEFLSQEGESKFLLAFIHLVHSLKLPLWTLISFQKLERKGRNWYNILKKKERKEGRKKERPYMRQMGNTLWTPRLHNLENSLQRDNKCMQACNREKGKHASSRRLGVEGQNVKHASCWHAWFTLCSQKAFFVAHF